MSTEPDVKDMTRQDFIAAGVWIIRIPSTCTHGQGFIDRYEAGNPNYPDRGEWLEGMRQALYAARRAMVSLRQDRKDLAHDKVDVSLARPEHYVVETCSQCEADRAAAWLERHWDRSPWERQTRFVRALAVSEMKSGDFGITEAQTVLHLAKVFHLTRWDFKELDEQPGRWGYDIVFPGDRRKYEWHWKLRRVRNSMAETLFSVMEANEAEGYKDENMIPVMPPTFHP